MDSESGVNLLYKSYMDIPINEDLVSGLLTALNQFTIIEFKQGIESIDMGGLRWVYLLDKESGLLYIAAGTKEDSAEILRARLNVIKQEFTQTYVKGDGTSWRRNWNGNVEMFYPFKKIIDQYYFDWLAAQNITVLGEFYDILGIFQQLLFDILATLNHLSEDSKDLIYDKIDIMFENYGNNEYVKQTPELSKITYSREGGINIITINPNNCDMIVVEKQIINLIRRLVETIKSDIGQYESMKYFIEEGIFAYILSNIVLLNKLNLDKFLLNLFLM